MAITATRDKVRLEIGDVDADAPLFSDEELDYFIDARSDNVYLAAADACEALARRFARKPDFSTDNQAFKWAEVSKQYQALADSLRSRAHGLTTVVTTRVDGYSQDITNEDVNTTEENVRGRYRRLNDAPF